ncbi:MAG: phosphoenolpyruvate synthase [Parcubacteria group bacterium]|nr:phosphoenolpyruvate synthase [Parcubacteria group bacterium]
MANKNESFILWFKDVSIEDVPLVGGKNASLGEMYQKLTPKGVKVPNGFATTARAYWYFLEKSGIQDKIKEILTGLDTHNMDDLNKRGEAVRLAIMDAQFPDDLKNEIVSAYKEFSQQYKKESVDVAVRSSATAEDLPTASFAGQQESYLNITGVENLLLTVKKCVASLFTNRAISYRVDKGFDHFKVALSVGVQKMVRSDLAASGVMFSCDTESGFADATLINASYGLGENIVKGKVNPDEFFVFETTLAKDYRPIVSRTLGTKVEKLIYDFNGVEPTKNIPVVLEDRNKFCISDDEVLQLGRWSVVIEQHYNRAMDIEWAKDGETGELYIVQARPETVKSQRNMQVLEEYVLEKRGEILAQGSAVGSKIGQGKSRIIKDVTSIGSFKEGEVLVTEMTDPDWEPIMKIASAIVTNAGGRTAHAAIVSRELGIPCIVGTKTATDAVKNGEEITISCAEGATGYVYRGKLPFKINTTNLENFKKPKTKIMMNVGEPEQAFALSFIPNDGVGLAREEFIINTYIKIHPNALINFEKLTDLALKSKIEQLTLGYQDKKQFYIDKLAEGIGMLGAAFYPKDVIVRFSDFKTNEYANLIGGKYYEPFENNPMIGWRGASRYYAPEFKEAFLLECRAIQKVREEFGLDNVIVMVPFCRTVEEGKKVIEIIDTFGLRKESKKGLKPLQIYVMAEIPSNVILVEEFAKIFDGFSIGSNDLTQLTLGVDRDSQIVSHVYDERNPAVKILLKVLIDKAHKNGKKVGICGQAPSDFPDFATFLVECGIDSISLNPDTVIKTTLEIVKTEEKLGK